MRRAAIAKERMSRSSPFFFVEPAEEEDDRPGTTVEEAVAKLGRIGQGLEVLPPHTVGEDHRPPLRRDPRSEPRLLFEREMDYRRAAQHPPLPSEVGEPLADAPASPQPRVEGAVDADDVGDALLACLLRRGVLRIEVQRVDVDDVVAAPRPAPARGAARGERQGDTAAGRGTGGPSRPPCRGRPRAARSRRGVPGLGGEAEVGRVDGRSRSPGPAQRGRARRRYGGPSRPRRERGNDVQHPHSLAAARRAATIPSAHASMLYARTSCAPRGPELRAGAPASATRLLESIRERSRLAGRHDETVPAGTHQVGGAPDLVADDDREPEIERLVHHEAPRLVQDGRKTEDVRCDVGRRELALVRKPARCTSGPAAASISGLSSPSPTNEQRALMPLAHAPEGFQQHERRLLRDQLGDVQHDRHVVLDPEARPQLVPARREAPPRAAGSSRCRRSTARGRAGRRPGRNGGSSGDSARRCTARTCARTARAERSP